MCPIKTFKIYQKKEEWVTSELLEYIKEKDELTMIARELAIRMIGELRNIIKDNVRVLLDKQN